MSEQDVTVGTGTETASNTAVSYGGPGEHAACDAEIARLRARLAEVRQVAVDFRNYYAGVLHPNAEALYHAVLQVIDRVPLGGQEQERSDEDEAASPVAAELPGQLPLPGTETP